MPISQPETMIGDIWRFLLRGNVIVDVKMFCRNAEYVLGYNFTSSYYASAAEHIYVSNGIRNVNMFSCRGIV